MRDKAKDATDLFTLPLTGMELTHSLGRRIRGKQYTVRERQEGRKTGKQRQMGERAGGKRQGKGQDEKGRAEERKKRGRGGKMESS